jgi:outer membrane immunogenic protein
MRRVLLACLGMAVLVGSAAAADLPPRFDPVAPRTPFAPPVSNWTGLYVGINGGGAWGRSDWTTPVLTTGEFDLSGGLVGGTIGYNWQTGAFLFGLEGDIDWASINGTTNATCPLGCKTENTWLGTVRGRLGYTYDRFMPYVTGGVAFGDIRASGPGLIGANDTAVGWTVGAGIEFALVNNWTLKAEYLYVDLGDINCGLNCGLATTDNVSFRTNIFRGGVNLRF